MPSANSSEPAKFGIGCLYLFTAPFFLAGGAAWFGAWSKRAEETPELYAAIVAGLVFTSVAVGFLVTGIRGSRREEETKRLRTGHPDSPWMWRPDWARSQVVSESRSQLWTLWGAGLLWCLLSSPVLIFHGGLLLRGDVLLAAAVALFPAVGVGLIVWACRLTLREIKFGVSRVELTTLPGRLGGRLAGVVHAAIADIPEEVELTLDAVKLDRGEDRMPETLLWQEESFVPAMQLGRGPDGIAIPFEFYIPARCRPTDSVEGRNGVIWRLSAWAALPGVDYSATFTVPVYRIEGGSEKPPRPALRVDEARDPAMNPRRASLRQRLGPNGRMEYYSRPGQSVAGIVLTLGVAGIFAAFTYGLVWAEVHWAFPAMPGLVAAFFAFLAVDLAFGITAVSIGDDAVWVRGGLLGKGTAQRVGFDEIKRVSVRMSMREKGSLTRGARAWYDVDIERTVGFKVVAARHIRSRREAQWLADEIERRILSD